MSDPFLGEIKMFGGNFAPRGYMMCNGQIVGVQQNAALFAILGTTYGGNGQTTFGLPDLRGRSAIGWGQGPGLSPVTLGESDGTENTQLTISNLPSHTHPIVVSTAAANTDKGSAATVLAQSADTSLNAINIYGAASNLTTLSPVSCGAVGSNIPFSNLSPYLAVSMIIAVEGLFPSRN